VTEKFSSAKELFTSVSYQMSPLLLADHGTRSARIAEPWGTWPVVLSLGHEILVERIVLILELPGEL
jgi:hypothetical protein